VKLPVLVAAAGADWEPRVLAEIERPTSQLVIARRCVDIVDLLAVAASGQGRVALMAAELRRLDADAVDRLRTADVVPVAVVPRGDEATENRMRALGIEHVVPGDADVSVLLAVVREAVRRPSETATSTGRVFGDPTTSMALPPGAGTPLEPEEPERNGTVIAVWGPTGAPGRTTIAITLADEIARLGADVLLADADVYGGTVAAALGLLDESPGLAAACRQAAAVRLDAAALASHCWQLTPRLRVLTGLPLAARWPELRPAAVTAVLGAARRLAEFTVVDCGFSLEPDEEISFDTAAPRRNGATLAVLDAADVVLVVAAADPIGMQRLVRALAELRDAEVTAPVHVVLNKVRRGVIPGNPAAELAQALEQFTGRTATALLPYDRDALDAALAAGRSLGEQRPSSPLRKAVIALAASLSGRAAPARHASR
jgi:Flp pilus assembly CpaE family ATPase